MRLVEKIGEGIVKTIYTAVDMLGLFDKVMLHEVRTPFYLCKLILMHRLDFPYDRRRPDL